MAKSKLLALRFEPEELEKLKRAAKLAGKSVSDWIRDLGAAAVAPPKAAVQLFPQPHAGVEIKWMGEENPGYPAPEESVVAPHPVAVLEHAARAEASIGRSVTEFLMTNAAKIAPSSLESPEVVAEDPYEKKCRLEFGRKALDLAAGDKPGMIRGWDSMSWQEKFNALKSKREEESPWA